MIKLACGIRGCWPIIVTSTSTETTLLSTEISNLEMTINSVTEHSNNSELSTCLLAVIILVIALIVLITAVVYVSKQQKKKNAQAKLMQVTITAAQANAVK